MALTHQPSIHWDEENLKDAALFLCVANPQGNPDIDSKIKYIKNYATTSLMEVGKPIDISTGGWQVCFYLNTNDSGYPIDFEYYAKVSITPYTANCYMNLVKEGKFVFPRDEDSSRSYESKDDFLSEVGLTD